VAEHVSRSASVIRGRLMPAPSLSYRWTGSRSPRAMSSSAIRARVVAAFWERHRSPAADMSIASVITLASTDSPPVRSAPLVQLPRGLLVSIDAIAVAHTPAALHG
jgi:hypothetical protein